jgi:tRNA-binding protein
MPQDVKPTVSKDDTFDLLEIRLGRVVSVQVEPTSPKKSYKLLVDFGKFGTRTSVARLTMHAPEELQGKLVLGVLNFEPRKVGDVESEVLILGVQYPKAESGEATFVTPANVLDYRRLELRQDKT